MEFCCQNMKYHVNDSFEIDYSSTSRAYSLELKRKDKGWHQELYFCPWCGKKLPGDLSDKWITVLEEEFQITDPLFDEKHLVPEEFKSDAWWKKRGL